MFVGLTPRTIQIIDECGDQFSTAHVTQLQPTFGTENMYTIIGKTGSSITRKDFNDTVSVTYDEITSENKGYEACGPRLHELYEDGGGFDEWDLLDPDDSPFLTVT